MATTPVLDVQGLTTYYRTKKGLVRAVENVSFTVERGDSFGLVGESGCGKTSIGMSILKLLPPNAQMMSGRVLLSGEDLVPKTEEEMSSVRWRRISMVFQAAMNALNPVYRVGDQIVEAIKTHNPALSKADARRRVAELFGLVGMDPDRAWGYPHEYSGGMRQRAVIAMALALEPELVVADEPTTALDVIVQDQIIAEMVALQRQLGMTLIYISHDIAVIAETCNKMGVMYAGGIVEYGFTKELYTMPLHPYTKGLMASYPRLVGELTRLSPIPGEPPNLIQPPSGCRFHPRCPEQAGNCREVGPQLLEMRPGHFVACHYAHRNIGR